MKGCDYYSKLMLVVAQYTADTATAGSPELNGDAHTEPHIGRILHVAMLFNLLSLTVISNDILVLVTALCNGRARLLQYRVGLSIKPSWSSVL